ncbi:MAG: hypothetical protein MHMPM18_000720 [Marteilia pararefringens]
MAGKLVDNKCLINRGSILERTEAALCLVAYTGHNAMIMAFSTNFLPRSTHINLLIDRIIYLFNMKSVEINIYASDDKIKIKCKNSFNISMINKNSSILHR